MFHCRLEFYLFLVPYGYFRINCEAICHLPTCLMFSKNRKSLFKYRSWFSDPSIRRRRRRPIPYTVCVLLFLPPPPFRTFWRFYCIYIFHYKSVAKNLNWRHTLFSTHSRALYNSKFSLNFLSDIFNFPFAILLILALAQLQVFMGYGTTSETTPRMVAKK